MLLWGICRKGQAQPPSGGCCRLGGSVNVSDLERENRRLRQALATSEHLCTQLAELLEAHRRADDTDPGQLLDWVDQIRARRGVHQTAA